ncbi:hypothetical protein CLOM_g16012 [Closterium sp. NIES-68]|nr:hypothetical protein CLOM_g1069 [Closterium sp. NIES-68]GJP56960.1 hypothetical protein CLOM_g16012 [Closterium sp. NIES-68]GJP79483.1 hypothetical protein CLOP_g9714 [Closterium sp. NIES-67]GJP84033.1 hypothetical protein CLOP_g14125 [Closterium sp. NIES-67]
MRPCVGWAPIRGAAMIDVLTTQTTGTNEIRYGLMVQGVAAPPAKMTVYSTDPCDPLVTSPKKLVELSGKWYNISPRRGPTSFTMSGSVLSSALPVQTTYSRGRGYQVPVFISFAINSTMNSTIAGKFRRDY